MITREQKIKLLQSLKSGEIKADDLNNETGSAFLQSAGNMFVKNDGEGNGYFSNTGTITDKEFEEFESKMLEVDRKRELLGLPMTIYMVIS